MGLLAAPTSGRALGRGFLDLEVAVSVPDQEQLWLRESNVDVNEPVWMVSVDA